MKLLTNTLRAVLPPLYSQGEVEDPTVWVKFFTPDSSWTWFATEGSPVDENGVMLQEGMVHAFVSRSGSPHRLGRERPGRGRCSSLRSQSIRSMRTAIATSRKRITIERDRSTAVAPGG